MPKETTKKATKRSLPAEVRLAVKAGQEKKGEDICVLDLREVTSFTEFFVIMHGNSSRQNVAICEGIAETLKREKVTRLSIEGRENAEWILMDYGSFIVHVFSKPSREHYSLEKLWGDAPKIVY